MVKVKVLKDSPFEEISVDSGVSCDGTWRKRGFQSQNGVFTAISSDTGKIVDVEPISCACKAYYLKEDLKKRTLVHMQIGITLTCVDTIIKVLLEE